MNISNTFNNQNGEAQVFNSENLPEETSKETQAQAESQWRRVLEVILIDGEIRYLVDRGE